MNKTILVTGSSSGMGCETAIACAKLGFTVLVHYHTQKDGAEKTLSEVKKYSSGKIYGADVSNLAEVKKLFSDIQKDFKTVDMLVNNAGVCHPGEMDDYALWESEWKTDFMSQVYVTNEFLKLPHDKSVRKIVNISSGYGIPELGQQGYPQYSVAKAAVISFTCMLAKKYAPSVLVNSVSPGYTLTPMWGKAPAESDADTVKKLNKIQRFVKPEEIAHAVVFLLTNDAMTGQIVEVDGGLRMFDIL